MLNKKLPYNVVLSQAKLKWENLGFNELITSGNEIYLFKFNNESGGNGVLSLGPCTMAGTPLMLKKWEADVIKQPIDKFGNVSIWVKLFGIPLRYWTVEGWVQPHIPFPKGCQCMQEPAMKASRITYSRICIDIAIESEFPEKFVVEIRV